MEESKRKDSLIPSNQKTLKYCWVESFGNLEKSFVKV